MAQPATPACGVEHEEPDVARRARRARRRRRRARESNRTTAGWSGANRVRDSSSTEGAAGYGAGAERGDLVERLGADEGQREAHRDLPDVGASGGRSARPASRGRSRRRTRRGTRASARSTVVGSGTGRGSGPDGRQRSSGRRRDGRSGIAARSRRPSRVRPGPGSRSRRREAGSGRRSSRRPRRREAPGRSPRQRALGASSGAWVVVVRTSSPTSWRTWPAMVVSRSITQRPVRCRRRIAHWTAWRRCGRCAPVRGVAAVSELDRDTRRRRPRRAGPFELGGGPRPGARPDRRRRRRRGWRGGAGGHGTGRWCGPGEGRGTPPGHEVVGEGAPRLEGVGRARQGGPSDRPLEVVEGPPRRAVGAAERQAAAAGVDQHRRTRATGREMGQHPLARCASTASMSGKTRSLSSCRT